MAGEPLITVVGNLVGDPEPRVSQAGKSWTTFRIASTPRVRDRQSGDFTDGETLWLGCRAYGQYADNIVQSLMKGSRVIVQGRLSQRSYTDQQGQERTTLDLEVEEIGPVLRFATAVPQKVEQGHGGGQAGGFGGAPQGGGFGQQQAQGQPAWGQPAAQQPPAQQQAQGNPWAGQQGQQQPPQGGGFGAGFDDEQPF